jgi:ABC-type transport system involved in multi-copper enzyme maturation permease subunit
MKAFLAISRVTFIEFARQRVVFVTAFVGIFLVLLTWLLSSMSLDERLRITVHIGFGSIQVTQGLLALFLGGTLLSKELDRQTLFILLARPISRRLVFWSKWFGMAALLAHIQLLLGSLHAILIFEGINWIRFLWVQIELYFEALCLLSVAMTLSVLLRPALVIASAFSIWLGGYWQNELIYFAERSKSAFFSFFAKASPYVFPNFIIGSELRSVYFLSADMIEKWGVLSVIQIVLYGLIFLFVGDSLFDRRDLA